MTKSIAIETRLVLTKSFPPGTANLKFGRYQIKPIPSTLPDETEAILEFADSYEAPSGRGSHPREEASIVCNLLSVILEARIQRSVPRINSIDIPSHEKTLLSGMPLPCKLKVLNLG